MNRHLLVRVPIATKTDMITENRFGIIAHWQNIFLSLAPQIQLKQEIIIVEEVYGERGLPSKEKRLGSVMVVVQESFHGLVNIHRLKRMNENIPKGFFLRTRKMMSSAGSLAIITKDKIQEQNAKLSSRMLRHEIHAHP